MESARLATAPDLEMVAELVAEGVAEQADSRGGAIWSRRETRHRPYLASLEALMSDSDQELWVGLIDETVVGYAAVRVEVLTDGELLGVVEDLYVDMGTREVGVGEALIAEAIAWCERRNCVGVDVLALPGNRATKNFFEGSGFKARLLTLHHSFEQPPTR